jgi:hypothetical protein
MKIFKRGMRVWITIASLFSFLAGWILLAHSNKPAPLQVAQPTILSPASSSPFQSSNPSFNSGGFSFPVQSQPTFNRPILRTGGS